MTILIISCFISLVVFIWFKTDAFVEYSSLFGFKHEEYIQKKKTEEFPLNYPRFLRMRSDNFFIKLITCPICFTVASSLLISTLFIVLNIVLYSPMMVFLIPLIFLTSIPSILSIFPLISILSLFIYGGLCRILNL